MALKLIRPEPGEPELYDLKADVGEQQNIAADRPRDVARLSKAIEQWHAMVEDPKQYGLTLDR